MNIRKKILIGLTIFFIILLINNIKVFAIENENYKELINIAGSDFVDPTENPEYWDPSKDDSGQTVKQSEPELVEKAGILLGSISTIGIVSAVIVMALLGMKYFMGSVEEKADIKKSLSIYILGIILLVACTTIPNIIYTLTQEVFK